jgi:NAD(P)-dependent dehydrogenase (short-subunit alcohol dehydrogenase family)
MVDRLKGKLAVVTGAANGIGQGCVDAFRAEGAEVIGIDIEHGDIVCDLTDEQEVQSRFRWIMLNHGRIDVLVNAAAFAVFEWIEKLSYDSWKRTLTGESWTSCSCPRAPPGRR